MSNLSGPIPVRANVLIVAVVIAANALQFLILPLYLLPLDPGWGLLLALIVLTTTTFWSLIHEAIHGHLLPNKRWSDRAGRFLCILFGSPFQLLRLGHLMHHRFNRTPLNCADVHKVLPKPSLRERVWYFFNLLGGLYLFELMASAFAQLPKRYYRWLVFLTFGDETPDGRTMMRAAERQLNQEPGRTIMRIDGLLVLVLFGTSFWLYGQYWWMLALALWGRGFMISFFDNAYHYGNTLEDVKAGYNLRLPRLIERAFLNFNMHEVHHRDPNLPWSGLPARFEKDGDRYHIGYLDAALRQLGGPIPEPEAAAGDHDVRRYPSPAADAATYL
ncbi:MAG: fatty acid desaturase [Pseudomonadota bacterium]